MKRIFCFLGVALTAFSMSCTKDADASYEVTPQGKVNLAIAFDDTRVALNGKAVVWSAGDAVNINGQNVTVPQDAIGTSAAKFQVEAADSYKVVYPASAVDTLVRQVSIPTVQSNLTEFNSSMCVLIGESTTPNVTLKHYNGYVKVSLNRVGTSDLKAVTLIAAGGESVAGEFDLKNMCGEAAVQPICTYNYKKVVENIAYDGTGKAEVIFSVPAQNYTKGFTLRIETVDGKSQTKTAYSASGKEITPATMIVMPDVDVNTTETLTYIANASELEAYLASTESGTANLDADVTLTSQPTAKALAAGHVFDGCGHTITVQGQTAALFSSNAGTIRNLNLQTEATITSDASMAVLAQSNSGIIEQVRTYGKMEITGDLTVESYIGAVCAQSTGTIRDCENNAEITITPSSIAAMLHIGGVMGGYVGTTASTEDAMVNCVNNGNVSVSYSGKPKNTAMGGVIGGTESTKLSTGSPVSRGVYRNLRNYGNISYEYTTKGTGTYMCMGGVAGFVEGAFSDAFNYGHVTFKNPTDTGSAGTSPAVGGVVGASIYGVENLVNYGTVTVAGAWNAGTAGATYTGSSPSPSFGGVAGRIGGTTILNDTSDCYNYGKIEIDYHKGASASTSSYSGGVFAYCSTNMKNCENHVSIDVVACGKSNYLGGVVGGGYGNIENCTNYGNLSLIGDAANVGTMGLAGIVAMAGTKGMTMTNLTNKGKLEGKAFTSSSTSYQYLGGIMGNYDGNTQSIVDCVNEGEIVCSWPLKVRVGGITAAIYDSTQVAPSGETPGTPGTTPLTRCINTGKITVNNAANPASSSPGSIIGGIGGYFSAGCDGCQSKGDIVLNGCDATTGVGCIGGAINRCYAIISTTVDMTITSDASVKQGLVGGVLYTTDGTTNFTLGATEQPLIFSAATKVDGKTYAELGDAGFTISATAEELAKAYNKVNVVTAE